MGPRRLAFLLPLLLLLQTDSLEDKCQKILCECDRKAAKCLAKAPYYPRYIFWPDFVCGDNHPKCKF
ncbi:Group 10 secretory phospholipase A2 [Chelonia mydas]|uniref:Group 10 secretory phospholipase A2 n=1 Tax=Chelonia mydas TaxID=8469 RepID=M7C9P4_CHEMY|nr:Group 10 secretory phospholipase A2 [Chelonia mydas]